MRVKTVVSGAGVAAAFLLAGCDDFRPCTLIGCENTLAVELGSLPTDAGTYTIEATGSAGSDTCSFDIDSDGVLVEDNTAGSCFQSPGRTADVTSLAVGPGDYEVVLSGPDGEVASVEVVEADFEAWAPNGDGCDPVCHTASVTLLPAGG